MRLRAILLLRAREEASGFDSGFYENADARAGGATRICIADVGA